jgi:hypothetical protein
MEQPKAIAECPIESCRWTTDITPEEVELVNIAPSPDPGTVFRAIVDNHERIIRAHLETHSLLDWVQEVTRLRTALDEATAADEPAEWRARIEAALLSIQSRLNEIPPARP